MSAASTALAIIGILLIIGGIALIALDYAGMGDTHGLDYKDVGIIVVGVILLVVGFVMRSRGSKASTPPTQSTGTAPQ